MNQSKRRRIQYFAAGVAAITAIVYVAMGLVLGAGAADMREFGLIAGASFGVVALLLFFVGRRLVWIPVALYQVAVIGMYFAVAGIREPPYEIWGITLKALQVVILVAVGYLAVRGARPAEDRSAAQSAVAAAR